ncbi:MFS transporter [Kutzneria buriramensis]|uniref:Putative MFS family arabinose efflux permease n=1 Tax=Kutzneria buriramensis TaxID=1045776 RepID=A0A3E0HK83_9PSEU|nr:MFS transporter [Kutzneria buriramensis]REH46882.1 putative MFS family arabinose efflux permease [Kutzneria buriramensis]
MSWRARFRVLAGAYSFSAYGSYLNMVALNLFVYQVTGSVLGMGAFMAVRLTSGVVAGAVARRLIARLGRRRIMVWANAAPAAALVALVGCPVALRLAMLFTTALISGVGATLFLVAQRSSVPEMVPADRLTWANSLVITGRSLAMVAGFASAGLVVSWWGYSAAMLVDAATFVSCGVIVACVRIAGVDTHTEPAPEPTAAPARRAWAALGGAVLAMIALRAVDAFGSSSHNVALPVYSTLLDPHEPATFVSEFWCCWAIGNVVVQQVVRRYGRSAGMRGFAIGTVLMSAAFVLGFAGLPLAPTLVFAFLAGQADGFTEVSYTTFLQRLPSARRDHAFALSATVENTGFGVGMIVNAGLLDRLSPLSVVAGSHGIAIAVGLSLLTYLGWHRGRDASTTVGTGRDHRDGVPVPRG